MVDSFEDENKRTERELRKREEIERLRLEKLEKEKKIPYSESPRVEPTQPKKESITKYLVPFVVLLLIGAVIYKYNFDILRNIRGIVRKIERILPEDFGTFIACFTGKIPLEQCLSGTPQQQIIKNKIVSVALGDDEGKLNIPMLGEFYYLPIKILNLREEEVFDINIIGDLDCEKRVDNEKVVTSIGLIPMISLPIKLEDKIETTLISESSLDCEIQNCKSIGVNVSYSYYNTLTTSFMVGQTRNDAKSFENAKLTPGPMSIYASFQPYDYYYLDRSVPEIDISLTFKNIADGEAIITDLKFEKIGDELNKFITPEECDCNNLKGLELGKDKSKSCFCKYSIVDPEGFLSGSRYKTIEFYFTVYYDYKSMVKRTDVPRLERSTCSDDTTPGTSNTVPTNGNIDNYLSSRSSGKSPLIGLKSCISSASSSSGVPISVFYAIPINEGGYSGTSLQKGSCNNLYSIKGSGCTKETWECYDSTGDFSKCTLVLEPGESENRCVGNKYYCKLVDNFKSYSNACESVRDFADLITNPERTERYANCPKDDSNAFVRCLQENGYTTDSAWATNVGNIIDTIESHLS